MLLALYGFWSLFSGMKSIWTDQKFYNNKINLSQEHGSVVLWLTLFSKGKRGLYVPTPCCVFCPLIKKSKGNTCLKILDFSKLFVADACARLWSKNRDFIIPRHSVTSAAIKNWKKNQSSWWAFNRAQCVLNNQLIKW